MGKQYFQLIVSTVHATPHWLAQEKQKNNNEGIKESTANTIHIHSLTEMLVQIITYQSYKSGMQCILQLIS